MLAPTDWLNRPSLIVRNLPSLRTVLFAAAKYLNEFKGSFCNRMAKFADFGFLDFQIEGIASFKSLPHSNSARRLGRYTDCSLPAAVSSANCLDRTHVALGGYPTACQPE
jgi:hypothetical protein